MTRSLAITNDSNNIGLDYLVTISPLASTREGQKFETQERRHLPHRMTTLVGAQGPFIVHLRGFHNKKHKDDEMPAVDEWGFVLHNKANKEGEDYLIEFDPIWTQAGSAAQETPKLRTPHLPNGEKVQVKGDDVRACQFMSFKVTPFQRLTSINEPSGAAA